MKLIFSPAALSDLARLREFIYIHNPDAATRATERIVEAVNTLLTFPKLGKPVDGSEKYRDLAFVFGARGYLMRYKVTPDVIRILRIWHVREAKK